VRIRSLIVGLGRISVGYDVGMPPERHVYTHARALTQHPAFDLLGGVDPDAASRARFEGEYGRPAFIDVGDALRVVSPDFVVIAVPTPLHTPVLREVLERARPAAVLCEKPLSYGADEARAMVQLCRDRAVRLFVNYMRRSDPGVVEVRRRLASGEITAPIKAVAWYSKGLLHNGSHIINLLTCWLGDLIDGSVIDPGRWWDGRDPEPDLRLRFERGAAVMLAAREEHFSHYTIELVAGNGRLRYDAGGEQIAWQAAVPDRNADGYTVLAADVEAIPPGMDRYQWHVADALASALAGGEANLCDGEAALRTLEDLQRVLSVGARV
jgi:predicted dehydrogenase